MFLPFTYLSHTRISGNTPCYLILKHLTYNINALDNHQNDTLNFTVLQKINNKIPEHPTYMGELGDLMPRTHVVASENMPVQQ